MCPGLCVSLMQPGDRQGTQGNRSACVASGTAELWTDSGPGLWGVGPRVWGSPLSLGGRGWGGPPTGSSCVHLISFRKPKKKLLLSG